MKAREPEEEPQGGGRAHEQGPADALVKEEAQGAHQHEEGGTHHDGEQGVKGQRKAARQRGTARDAQPQNQPGKRRFP